MIAFLACLIESNLVEIHCDMIPVKWTGVTVSYSYGGLQKRARLLSDFLYLKATPPIRMQAALAQPWPLFGQI